MDFINTLIAEILDKKPDHLEVADYDDSDIMFIKAVSIEEGLNANGALFERADIHRAYRSFVGKPLKIRMVNNDPTGHGYDPKTGKFDELVRMIGTIYGAEAQIVKPDGTTETVWNYDDVPEGDGKYQVVVYVGVWKKYFPEVANRLRQLHNSGELKFSIEAEREFELTPEGYRRCFNILFNGLAVVKTPAFDNARSLVVAELLNEGGKDKMNFEQMYNDLKKDHDGLVRQNALDVQSKELAEKAAKDASDKSAELAEKNAELTGQVKTLEADRDKYKSTVEQAEKLKVGQERHSKLAKYGTPEKNADELAELTKDEFVDVLTTMVEAYKPVPGQEQASKDDVLGAYFNTDGSKFDRKKALYDMVVGLSK